MDSVKVPDHPSYLGNLEWRGEYTRMTTPDSGGKVLAKDPFTSEMILAEPDYSKEGSSLQLWKMTGGSSADCFSRNSSRNVHNAHGGDVNTNSKTRPQTYFLGSGSNEQDNNGKGRTGHDGVWCHWYCDDDCRRGIGNPYDRNYVCASTALGVHGLDYHNSSEVGNVPGCKWITDGSAISCCMHTPEEVELNYKQYCYPSYYPNSLDSACPVIMQKYCENFWAKDENTRSNCESYFSQMWLSNPKDVSGTVKNLVFNYITSLNPQKYNRQRDGTPGGENYEFFSRYLPELCGLGGKLNTQGVPGPCDDILNQYCKIYTREDLEKDQVLQRICGCHLPTSPTEPPCVCSGGKCSGKCIDTGISVKKNQYLYGKLSCDPVCNISNTVENYSQQPCDQTLCIIDGFNVNQINSKGNVNLNLVCNSCSTESLDLSDTNVLGEEIDNHEPEYSRALEDKEVEQESSICSCYISNVVINKINSSGSVNINQNCGRCFTFDGDISTAREVDCGSLYKSRDDGKEKIVVGGAVVGVVVAVILISFGIYYVMR